MDEGKRYVFEVKMPPGRYWNLTYHWGWRAHPPRIQAVENAMKMVMGKPVAEWDIEVFGTDPRSSQSATWAAIDMIGDLAPAKRMWKALNALKAKDPAIDIDSDFYTRFNSNTSEADLVAELEASFDDWKDRTKLPRGVPAPKPGIDQTLFYANNAIYGTIHSVRDGPHLMAQETYDGFQERGDRLKIQLYNADYFPHAYMNVDFGGRRGWENIYQNTIPTGGQGPWFTFGRVYWSPNLMKPTLIPAATRPTSVQMQSGGLLNSATSTRTIALPEPPGTASTSATSDGIMAGFRRLITGDDNRQPVTPPENGKYFTWAPLEHPGRNFMSASNTAEGLGEHEVEIEFRFDPSKRLRFYQFDPLHHDQAILSIH
jgi:hypothetical protein